MYMGKRTEIHDFKETTEEGAGDQELLDGFPTVFCRYPKFVHTIRRITSASREQAIIDMGRRVVVLTGPTRTGKSRFVWSNFRRLPVYTKSLGGSGNSLFFDGYEGQKVVFFDEFLCDIRINTLNQLLDRYPAKVEVKGVTTAWVPTLVIIASNLPVEDWYPKVQEHHPDVYDALRARIHKVIEFPLSETVDTEALVAWMKEVI